MFRWKMPHCSSANLFHTLYIIYISSLSFLVFLCYDRWRCRPLEKNNQSLWVSGQFGFHPTRSWHKSADHQNCPSTMSPASWRDLYPFLFWSSTWFWNIQSMSIKYKLVQNHKNEDHSGLVIFYKLGRDDGGLSQVRQCDPPSYHDYLLLFYILQHPPLMTHPWFEWQHE